MYRPARGVGVKFLVFFGFWFEFNVHGMKLYGI